MGVGDSVARRTCHADWTGRGRVAEEVAPRQRSTCGITCRARGRRGFSEGSQVRLQRGSCRPFLHTCRVLAKPDALVGLITAHFLLCFELSSSLQGEQWQESHKPRKVELHAEVILTALAHEASGRAFFGVCHRRVNPLCESWSSLRSRNIAGPSFLTMNLCTLFKLPGDVIGRDYCTFY